MTFKLPRTLQVADGTLLPMTTGAAPRALSEATEEAWRISLVLATRALTIGTKCSHNPEATWEEMLSEVACWYLRAHGTDEFPAMGRCADTKKWKIQEKQFIDMVFNVPLPDKPVMTANGFVLPNTLKRSIR